WQLSPQANDDLFTFSTGPILNVPPPGVLANDTPGASAGALSAMMVTGPTNGTLTLNSNGGFNYIPGSDFDGADSFTYKNNDGVQDSLPATVTLTNANPVTFADDFARGSDPGPVAPWVVRAGAWVVTGGEMQGGTNATQTYANVYLTNSWSDYAVQARLRFPAGAFGGAL